MSRLLVNLLRWGGAPQPRRKSDPASHLSNDIPGARFPLDFSNYPSLTRFGCSVCDDTYPHPSNGGHDSHNSENVPDDRRKHDVNSFLLVAMLGFPNIAGEALAVEMSPTLCPPTSVRHPSPSAGFSGGGGSRTIPVNP